MTNISNDKRKNLINGGKILSQILKELEKLVLEKGSGIEIEQKAIELTKKYNVEPAFYKFHGYPHYVCISVNDTVVHGIPNKRPFKDGDLISIDFGIRYKHRCFDAARSYCINNSNKKALDLINATKQSYYQAQKILKDSVTTGDIGFTIENFLKKTNYHIIKDLSGHGIGETLQEEPSIYNFGKKGSGYKLFDGKTIAIEPMLATGSDEVYLDDDNWSVKTSDGSLSAHWENTLLITKDSCINLTE